MTSTREKKPKLLSWEPLLVGSVYCSPGCGAGCTKVAHDEALRLGAALAARCGTGWSCRVWENLGWHHEAISPCGRLHVSGSWRHFTAYLNSAGRGGGRWAEHGESPKRAIARTVAVAREELAEIAAIVEGL